MYRDYDDDADYWDAKAEAREAERLEAEEPEDDMGDTREADWLASSPQRHKGRV